MKFNWNLIKPGFSSILITVVMSILLCVMLTGCKINKSEGRAVTYDYWYVIAKIDGHDYVIGGVAGHSGTGLTHSESCSCKKGKPD